MKKVLKTSVFVLLVAVMMTFAGCGSTLSKKSADEINEAVKNGNPMTVTEVKEKYGAPVNEYLQVGTGYMVFVNSCKTWEEVESKIESGEEFGGMVVLCLAGNATVAVWYDNYQGQTN